MLMGEDLDVSISDNSEGSLVLMTCEEFELRYPEIAESQHEFSYKQPARPKPKGHSGSVRKQSTKVRHSGFDDTENDEIYDQEMLEDSEDVVDESSSYRA